MGVMIFKEYVGKAATNLAKAGFVVLMTYTLLKACENNHIKAYMGKTVKEYRLE